MRRHGVMAAFGLVAALVAGQTFAATMNFWLSEEGVGALTAGPSNPDITLNVGETATLTLWVATPGGASLIGGSFGIAATDPAILTTNSVSSYNPTVLGQPRWNAGFLPGTAGEAVTNVLYVALGGPNGVGSALTELAQPLGDPTYNAAQDAFALLTFEVQADAVGVTELFLELEGGGMVYAGVDGANTLATFGAGDDAIVAVGSLNPGGRSLLADATITVVPEPASLSLLALGALALVRRR